MTSAAGLPEEMLPGVPLIELCGNRQVLVENHRGVKEYGTERVLVRLHRGCLVIRGRDLVLRRMERRTLVITGHVDGVDFETGVPI